MLKYALMILGFGVVILGAESLIRGASALAKRLKVSDMAIALTVVAFGTSLPELFVNLTASVKGEQGIALGNIIGSNTANILLILGISGVICPLAVTRGTVWKEIPLSLLAVVLVGILANDRLVDGGDYSGLTRSDGLVFLSFFAIFLYYSAGIAGQITGMAEQVSGKQYELGRILVLITAGLSCLIVGSRWLVDGAVEMASRLGVSQSVIGLSIVAVGTSLPELTTSAVAAYKGKFEIAVGNVVGSNIFNVFFILGVSSIIRPIPFEVEQNVDVGVSILASLVLLLFMFTGKRRVLDRWESAILILLYVVYVGLLVARASSGRGN
jgi:cation:H+ antiporter